MSDKILVATNQGEKPIPSDEELQTIFAGLGAKQDKEIVDDVTGEKITIGVANGALYYKVVE